MPTIVQWTDLREFSGVDLESSYLLSWSQEGETLILDIDMHLLPDHPFYEKPRPAQKACLRPAFIEFPYCESVKVDGADIDAGRIAAGELSLGRISGLDLVNEGEYELRGEFGNVLIKAERPLLRLKGH